MNAALIFFSINAMMRLAQSGRLALEDYAADKKTIFPDVKFKPLPNEEVLGSFFRQPVLQTVLAEEAFKETVDDTLQIKHGRLVLKSDLSRSQREQVLLLYLKIKRQYLKESASDFLVESAEPEDLKNKSDEEIIGAFLVRQWSEKNDDTRGPMARMVFTIGAIAAEYIQMDPSLFGAGGRGEILIKGFSGVLATNLNAYISGSDFSPRAKFAEHAAAILLRAGLSALQQNANALISEDHISLLVGNTLDPIIKAIPEDFDINTELDFKAITEAFMGPALSAALDVVAKSPASFFGSGFEESKAAGALAGALLAQMAEQGVPKAVTSEGLFALYKAGLNVVSVNPELFIGFGDPKDPKNQIAETVFKTVITALKSAPGPFDSYFKDAPPMIMAAALEAVGKNVHRLASSDEWEQLAASLTSNVLEGFAAEFKAGDSNPFEKLISKTQLVELGRIVVEHVAGAPNMVGVRSNEARQVVRAIAQAMAADEKLLLSNGNWRVIAEVAAREAAANPGRLFGLNLDDRDENLAADLIKMMLTTASSSFGEESHDKRAVLYGTTLQDAIALTIRTYSGAPALAKQHQAEIKSIIEKLNSFISDHHAYYGNKEWLRLYRVMLIKVMKDGDMPALDGKSDADRLLRSGVTP